ncbi:MAG: pyrimidine reductase family protein [Acidimicrobiia bacterium]|nr:pyrimidine reductase family protein [Acidimicrobiia bacterium]
MRRLREAEAIEDLLAPYESVDRAAPAGRPWVLANMVAGLDGSAAFGGRVGPLSQGADMELFRVLRAVADIVLVGAATFRTEGYGPVRLPEDRQATRRSDGRSALPTLAVVTRSLDLDWSSPAFAASSCLVVTSGGADSARVEAASAHADIVQTGDAAVDLGAALGAFAAAGHRVVLCEGGPTLLGELVELDLLDELCLTLGPVMGGDPLPVALTRKGGDIRQFVLRHVATDGQSLFLRYERERSDGP